MTVHNYRSRQVHETLNGVNPSSRFRDRRSAKSGPNLCQIWQVFGPLACPYGANGQMKMTVHNCQGLDNSTELQIEEIRHYLMLCADFNFRLVNNHEVYTHISCFTSSGWDIKRKERHHGDHNHHPLFLLLQCGRVTLCLYNDLGQLKGIAGILKLWKHIKMWQTSFEH